jgi:transcriptional regulator with XRE-family HTH domain
MQLGRVIRRLRKERRLTIEDLASKANLHTTTLSKIELGRRNPTWRVVKKLAGALDVTIAYVASLEEDELRPGSRSEWDVFGKDQRPPGANARAAPLLLGGFGERVRERRLLAGLTEGELAIKCGLGTSRIIRLEQGRYDMRLSHVWVLCHALDVSPSQLLEG